MATAPQGLSTPPKRVRHRRLVLTLIGLVAGGVAIVVIAELAGGVSDAVEALRDVDPRWVAAGLGCEAVSYLFIAGHLRRLTGSTPRFGFGAAYQLALVVYGLGIITPASPAEGLALGAAELRRRGMPRRRVYLALGLSEWFSTGTLYAIAAVDLLIAGALADLHRDERLPAIIGAAGVLVVLVLLTVVASRRTTVEIATRLWHRVMFWRVAPPAYVQMQQAAELYDEGRNVLGSRWNRAVLVVLVAGAWLADGLCLQCALVAAGVHVSFDVLFLAYSVGIIAAEIPLVPGGFGITEIAMPAVLHHYGVPFAPALAGALVYRALGTLAPAGIGALAALSLRSVRHPSEILDPPEAGDPWARDDRADRTDRAQSAEPDETVDPEDAAGPDSPLPRAAPPPLACP
ncbi:MAG: rane protein [Actinomycetia bacterium]|nr:rane protein [Actinomycetes bacterium]